MEEDRKEGKYLKGSPLVEIKSAAIREWVEAKADSRWKRTAVRFLDYVDALQFDPKIGRLQKTALLVGCREGLRVMTHPHHSSTSGIHIILDIIDERLRELGFAVPEDCTMAWKITDIQVSSKIGDEEDG